MIRPKNIPEQSKFLEGVGESAWFHIKHELISGNFRISRYNVLGELDCQYMSKINMQGFDLAKDFSISYVSHCMKCTVIQDGEKYVFVKI